MIHYRALLLENPNDAERTVEASLSSETPVHRPGLGREILSHAPGAIDLSRSPLPLITSHNRDETPVGIVENLAIAGGKLRGILRFGASERALDVWKDVQAGVLRSISIGYSIITATPQGDDYLVSRWMPYEASLVAVPADPNVGIGRSFSTGNIMQTNTQDETQENTLTRSQRRSTARSEQETRDATREILATAEQFDIPSHQVRDFISQHGHSLDLFRKYVMDNIRDTGSMRFAESGEIGMSDGEATRFSFQKAIMARLDPAYGHRHAGLEMEASRAVAQKLGRDPQGIFVPSEVLHRRDLSVGTNSAGGYLRPTDHSPENFIEILRNACHVLTLGATEIRDLRGNLAVPSQVGPGSAFWVAEGVAPTESAQTFGQMLLTPKTVGGFTDYTRKMMLQASPDIENLIRKDLAQILAVAVDAAAINGSGVGAEPLGVMNTPGIGSLPIGTNGGAATWDHVLQLEEHLSLANADSAAIAYMTNAKVRRKWKGTTKVSGDAGAGFIWDSQPSDLPGWGKVNGYRAVASNNVPSNLVKGSSGAVCSAIVLGNWSDLVIGTWGALDLLVDPYSNGTSGGIRVIAMLDTDIGVRRIGSFTAIRDALTT